MSAFYGFALYKASSDPAVGYIWVLAVIACIFLGLFIIWPESKELYILAGVTGLILWGGQAARLSYALLQSLVYDETPGLDVKDWRTISGIIAFTFFSTIWWNLWLSPVKKFHERQSEKVRACE